MSSKTKTNNSTSTSQKDTAINKLNYQKLEQERNMLKITLEYVATENDSLKSQLEDMRMTVKHNKELLKEYVDKITNKDKVVEKMNATIEQLTSRMQSLEEFIKQSYNTSVGNRDVTSNNILSQPNKKENKLNNALNLNSTTISNNTRLTGLTGNNITYNPKIFLEQTNLHSPHSNIIPPKTPKIEASPKRKPEDKIKEFYIKQRQIIEEMTSLKDDLQFIMENKTKTKIKEKLEQSHRSYNSNISKSCTNQLNESVISSNSAISALSAYSTKKKYNMKDKLQFENMNKFQEFLNQYHPNKNILLFLDSKNSFWELVKRNDLNMSTLLNNVDNLMSITSTIDHKSAPNTKMINIEGDESPKSKFYNLEIKERSFNNSELDISRMTDLNISHFIGDINDG